MPTQRQTDSLSNSASAITTAATRWAGIDALRGLCVLLVVLHHIHLRFVLQGYEVTTWLPRSLGRVVFWSGYYAVIAFFVISGFLITRLSIRRWGSLGQIDAQRFYVMRIARIVPCLLLLLIVLSGLHLGGVADFTIDPARASLGRALVAALGFHINWLEGARGYLPGAWDVLWSLSVEETFYLLFPVMCLLVKREQWILAPLFALIVIGPFYRVSIAGQEPWEEYAYFACMDAIAFGCLAALAATRLTLPRIGLRMGLAMGVSMILLIIVFRGVVFGWALADIGLDVTLLALGVALTVLALANDVGNPGWSRWTGWIQWVGRSSYEIYLSHMFVVLGVMQICRAMAPRSELFPAWYAAMLVLSIALGYVVSRFFSEPVNAALRARSAGPVATP